MKLSAGSKLFGSRADGCDFHSAIRSNYYDTEKLRAPDLLTVIPGKYDVAGSTSARDLYHCRSRGGSGKCAR